MRACDASKVTAPNSMGDTLRTWDHKKVLLRVISALPSSSGSLLLSRRSTQKALLGLGGGGGFAKVGFHHMPLRPSPQGRGNLTFHNAKMNLHSSEILHFKDDMTTQCSVTLFTTMFSWGGSSSCATTWRNSVDVFILFIY